MAHNKNSFFRTQKLTPSVNIEKPTSETLVKNPQNKGFWRVLLFVFIHKKTHVSYETAGNPNQFLKNKTKKTLYYSILFLSGHKANLLLHF
jgi:hypothetical protein